MGVREGERAGVRLVHPGVVFRLKADRAEEKPCILVLVVLGDLLQEALFGFLPLFLLHVQFRTGGFGGTALEACRGEVDRRNEEHCSGEKTFHDDSWEWGW
jgi:hypothetical protein